MKRTDVSESHGEVGTHGHRGRGREAVQPPGARYGCPSGVKAAPHAAPAGWRPSPPTRPGPRTQPLRPRFRPQINTYNSPTLKGLGEGQCSWPTQGPARRLTQGCAAVSTSVTRAQAPRAQRCLRPLPRSTFGPGFPVARPVPLSLLCWSPAPRPAWLAWSPASLALPLGSTRPAAGGSVPSHAPLPCSRWVPGRSWATAQHPQAWHSGSH